ncbi:MAG: hypothetical protein BWK80_40760 [Desulfobacteraceae bacterium IS3]|nr:MAG: hypothetical protein BWK80_40760 [Desulfobacteraceae bacterium IS3]HAO20281.1 hypothetical protein [Desulfobacteraceae bacterium]
MLNINKYYVYDQYQKPIAVQIAITDFERLEELIENYGLSQLMDETVSEERLTGKSALKYYESLKNEMES